MRDPIAYTYEADTHCEYCAKERFEPNEGNHYLVGTDNEGNEITPVHAFESTLSEDHDYSEGPNISGCGTCGRIIEAQTNEGGMVELYPFYSVSDYFKHWSEHKVEAIADELEDAKLELKQLRKHTVTLLDTINDFERNIRSWEEVGSMARLVWDECFYDGWENDDSTDDS